MRQARLIALATGAVTIAAAVSLSTHMVRGQSEALLAPVYNPYPPGIVPADINSELARVLREVNFIENEAIAQWHALPPLTRAGNPPVLQNNGVAAVEVLGKLMNFDKNISPNENIACGSCHMPYVGFSGPIPSVNLLMIAYPGSVHFRAGKRTAQRYTYSSYFPPLQFNATQGAFFGGNFWDSRATGYLLRSPDAEQAQGPPVDPNEMGNSDTACVVFKLSQAAYRPLFEAVWAPAHSTSTGRPIPRRSAPHRMSAGVVRRFTWMRQTAPAPIPIMITGRSPLALTSTACRSALSRRSSTPSWRARPS
jgi:cytochrome c peroxidase